MLPALVLTVAIRAGFWRLLKKQRKAEWNKCYYQCAVLDRMNKQTSKKLQMVILWSF